MKGCEKQAIHANIAKFRRNICKCSTYNSEQKTKSEVSGLEKESYSSEEKYQ